MRKFLLSKFMLLLSLMLIGAGSVWGEEVYYTLTPATGSNNNYASNCDVTISDITWNISGNSQQIPWRIGGKSITNTDRTVYSKTAMGAAISKVELTVGEASSITVKSLKLIVASDAKFSNQIDEVSATFVASSTITFEPTSGTEWATGAYYKFVFNVTVSGSSNKFVQFSEAKFYSAGSTPSSAASFTETTPSINYPANKTYSQTVTTAEGYTGTVTYEITDNTAGATIEGSTVTVTQGGSVTVKATAPEVSGSFLKSTASYTLTVTDTRSEAGLSYAASEQNVDKGSVLSAPTLTNPNSVAVTYSSSDETVATVDASGNVTGVAVGTATITATFAGNDNYLPGSASYTVNVKKPIPSGALFYESMSGYASTSDGTAAISASYVNLDSENWSSFTKVYAGGKQTGDEDGHLKFGSSKETGEAVTNSIALTGNGKLTFKVMRFNDKNNGELTVSVTGATATGDLTVTGTDAWVEHTVNLTGATGNVVITFATTSENERIRLDDIQLVQVGTITLNADCHDSDGMVYGTYSNSSAFVVPSGLTVSEITAPASSGTLTVTSYAEGDIVPANTGVMVSSTTAGEKSVVLTTAAGTAKTNNNMLKPTGSGIDADGMTAAAADCKYYRLTMHNGTDFGFYWGAESGAGFTLAANKAYLAVPNSTVKGYTFNDFVDAIKAVETEKAESKVIYNLAGQRVSKMQKGIYIVNGKKIFNK